MFVIFHSGSRIMLTCQFFYSFFPSLNEFKFSTWGYRNLNQYMQRSASSPPTCLNFNSLFLPFVHFATCTPLFMCFIFVTLLLSDHTFTLYIFCCTDQKGQCWLMLPIEPFLFYPGVFSKSNGKVLFTGKNFRGIPLFSFLSELYWNITIPFVQANLWRSEIRARFLKIIGLKLTFKPHHLCW